MYLKIYLFFLFVFTAFSADSQVISFSDQNFKEVLLFAKPTNTIAKDSNGNFVKVDANNDGQIQISEAENITYLSVTSWGIKRLDGIEFFKNLSYLDCSTNSLTDVDFSQNLLLAQLTCHFNYNLKTANLTNNVNLQKLAIMGSSAMTNIDLSNNINLTFLEIFGGFSALDLSNNTKLTQCRIVSDQLSNLIINNLTQLTHLTVESTSLSSIYTASNLQLQKLSLQTPALASMDITKNIILNNLYVDNLLIESIDLSKNSELLFATLYMSELNTIDITKNTKLTHFSSSGNFVNIDFSKNLLLENIQIAENPSLKIINTSNNPNLNVLNAYNLNNLQKVYIKNERTQSFGEKFLNCPKLTFICCDASEVSLFTNPQYTVTTDCLLSAENSDAQNSVSFYPNPAIDEITFSKKVSSVSVFDTSGKLVYKQQKLSDKLSTSALIPGHYIILVNEKTDSVKLKLFKK